MRAGLFRVLPALFCVCLVSGGTALLAQDDKPEAAATKSQSPQATKQAYESDRRYIAAIAEARKLVADEDFVSAVEEYRKANKITGGKCANCLDDLIALQMKMGLYKDAAATAAELTAMVKTPVEKSLAEGSRGLALYTLAGERPKPGQLEAADAAFKAALADYPKNLSVRYTDGMVLARMGQMDAARAQFEACVAQASPNDPAYLRAKRFAEDPEMSFVKRAPAFTVTALDGSKFTLDEMGGRVVLIDFWATWCPACNDDIPSMKKIAKDFAGQPLVIISVSWDADAKKWKDFIAKNKMGWVQYRDADQELTRQFGIDAIPYYFTIDSDGVLRAEILGSDTDVEQKLKKLVAKAKAAKEAASVAPSLATGAGN